MNTARKWMMLCCHGLCTWQRTVAGDEVLQLSSLVLPTQEMVSCTAEPSVKRRLLAIL